MKSVGSHPGAYSFRLILMVILITILVVKFFSYTDRISKNTESASVQQTTKVINSVLVVVFSSYAVNNKLSLLNELNGGNPFIYLANYNLSSVNYKGEIGDKEIETLSFGWYYDAINKVVIYKSNYEKSLRRFEISLDYDDINRSGEFEQSFDKFKSLRFSEILRS